MSNNNEMFELMTKMYGDMQDGFKQVNERIDNVETELTGVKSEVGKTNITIEHDVNPKLTALFDGYKQTYEKLTQIEKEVSKQEEVILRRIR